MNLGLQAGFCARLEFRLVLVLGSVIMSRHCACHVGASSWHREQSSSNGLINMCLGTGIKEEHNCIEHLRQVGASSAICLDQLIGPYRPKECFKRLQDFAGSPVKLVQLFCCRWIPEF